MRKIWILISVAMMVFLTNANAEMRYGISGALTQINADGTETEGGETTNASVDNLTVIPSIFVEFQSGGITYGLDYIPMDADVSDKTRKELIQKLLLQVQLHQQLLREPKRLKLNYLIT